MDRAVSGGAWESGAARPVMLGGRGVHGSFDPTHGVLSKDEANTYLWNTDDQAIPASAAGPSSNT